MNELEQPGHADIAQITWRTRRAFAISVSGIASTNKHLIVALSTFHGSVLQLNPPKHIYIPPWLGVGTNTNP
jgi:hypothetical protein